MRPTVDDVEQGLQDEKAQGKDSLENASLPSSTRPFRQRSLIFSFLIVFVGVCASVGFLVVGLRGAENDQKDRFARHSATVVDSIHSTFLKYETAGLFIHTACRHRDITRERFRELYKTLVSTGLEFQVVSFNPNTTQEERYEFEEESAEFYRENYPDIEYAGIQGLEPNDGGSELSVQNRSEQPFYFPVHFLEPVEGNEGAIDFDLYSSSSRRDTIRKIMETWKPELTPRLTLVQESQEGSYGVILMHPGTQLSTRPDERPQDFVSVVVRIPDLIKAAAGSQESPSTTYIFDSTDSSGEPVFLSCYYNPAFSCGTSQ